MQRSWLEYRAGWTIVGFLDRWFLMFRGVTYQRWSIQTSIPRFLLLVANPGVAPEPSPPHTFRRIDDRDDSFEPQK